jgi:HSP20 family protein
MPGLERKDVEISVEDDVRPSAARRKSKASRTTRTRTIISANVATACSIECFSCAGRRSVEDRGHHVNGVLKISILKPARSEPKKIEVKEAA